MTNTTDPNRILLEREQGLSKLVGGRLTSVQFILNYLILGFDERGALTTLVWPAIIKANAQLIFGMDQYRNELCSFIECKVTGTTIGPDETICIKFDNSAQLQIALGSYEGQGERAILTAPNHYLLVF
jgi:hypothetical protein